MINTKKWAVLLLIFLVILAIGPYACTAMIMTDEISIKVYVQGKIHHLSPDNADVQKLISTCERQLQGTDNILRLAVTPQLIEEIKRKEIVVEIHYQKVRTFLIAFNKKTIHIDRLFIPLSGDFAGEITTLFHGKAHYSAGPYRNRTGTLEIKAIIQRIGIQ